jgi:hypothetical protein
MERYCLFTDSGEIAKEQSARIFKMWSVERVAATQTEAKLCGWRNIEYSTVFGPVLSHYSNRIIQAP